METMNPNVVEIISIGKPYSPQRGRHLIVPCTVAIEVDGRRVEKKLESICVQRVMGHPNRRIIRSFEKDAFRCN